jgi:AraC-like DNA-binding protein
MSLFYEERPSDSPYVEKITYGRTVSDDSVVRPAECHWHMVLARFNGHVRPIIVGPLTTSGIASWSEGAEILWIKFKLGTYMPHLPARDCLDSETMLPGAASNSFWLKGSAWQFPDYENVDTFVDRLVRNNVLVRDPVVDAALKDQPQDVAPRTVRHRFLRTTGLTQSYIRQIERAQRAATLLEQGLSILDTVEEVGYFDQPHLTRSLKRFVGQTPAQIIRMSRPKSCESTEGSEPVLDYRVNILASVR